MDDGTIGEAAIATATPRDSRRVAQEATPQVDPTTSRDPRVKAATAVHSTLHVQDRSLAAAPAAVATQVGPTKPMDPRVKAAANTALSSLPVQGHSITAPPVATTTPRDPRLVAQAQRELTPAQSSPLRPSVSQVETVEATQPRDPRAKAVAVVDSSTILESRTVAAGPQAVATTATSRDPRLLAEEQHEPKPSDSSPLSQQVESPQPAEPTKAIDPRVKPAILVHSTPPVGQDRTAKATPNDPRLLAPRAQDDLKPSFEAKGATTLSELSKPPVDPRVKKATVVPPVGKLGSSSPSAVAKSSYSTHETQTQQELKPSNSSPLLRPSQFEGSLTTARLTEPAKPLDPRVNSVSNVHSTLPEEAQTIAAAPVAVVTPRDPRLRAAQAPNEQTPTESSPLCPHPFDKPSTALVVQSSTPAKAPTIADPIAEARNGSTLEAHADLKSSPRHPIQSEEGPVATHHVEPVDATDRQMMTPATLVSSPLPDENRAPVDVVTATPLVAQDYELTSDQTLAEGLVAAATVPPSDLASTFQAQTHDEMNNSAESSPSRGLHLETKLATPTPINAHDPRVTPPSASIGYTSLSADTQTSPVDTSESLRLAPHEVQSADEEGKPSQSSQLQSPCEVATLPPEPTNLLDRLPIASAPFDPRNRLLPATAVAASFPRTNQLILDTSAPVGVPSPDVGDTTTTQSDVLQHQRHPLALGLIKCELPDVARAQGVAQNPPRDHGMSPATTTAHLASASAAIVGHTPDDGASDNDTELPPLKRRAPSPSLKCEVIAPTMPRPAVFELEDSDDDDLQIVQVVAPSGKKRRLSRSTAAIDLTFDSDDSDAQPITSVLPRRGFHSDAQVVDLT
ncbi:hypothetical protein, variant 2 [Aphanomyces astaci]|nr:hypothetical protein, variant 1 [Aphanomyces astaci]XP_009826317.1 hypothetical protein, variant 2 [Aphanomyces astaci]ETV84624.1 hypothetical protein, variant 1 [Aphanomyces astaci]ETV84625.1 hypothetical protein, variant 2 [Aphanomyces astaci]|eukprot:XP_009826316.1 hypothetical protein, variant 1 [Aphanomyces astaci]